MGIFVFFLVISSGESETVFFHNNYWKWNNFLFAAGLEFSANLFEDIDYEPCGKEMRSIAK